MPKPATQFLVNYQPIVFLKTGLITGFEALVRWRPSGGSRIISPGEFIPVAEETGLIVPIGWWVMQTACQQTRTWMEQFPEHPGLSVAVNLSARHFQQADLVERIHSILDETGLPPANLKLEITESMLMGDAEAHVRVIRRLRASGVQVHIDDFGTGYSSLSYLQRFSVDTLKIDKSFISDAETNETWEIVQMIIALARDMGVNVIAEGVESEEQTRKLRALECGHAQGFLFHRPVDADTAGALLAAQQLRNV
jgi:EAL domain-containing protein (putative c-di-GMP-specific phosphodiesterase class I)